MSDLLGILSDLIKSVIPKYAFILDNGKMLKSTIAEENILKIIPFIPGILKKVQLGEILHSGKIFIGRLSEQFIILFLTDLEKPVVEILFSDIFDRYSTGASLNYSTPHPLTLRSIVNQTVFSVSLSTGPQPVAWLPKDIEELILLNITMKSMLNLSGELDGAYKRMMSTQPFPQYNSLAVIYLFQIPNFEARGGAYDCSITFLVDYGNRAMIYEKFGEIEILMNESSQIILNECKNDYQFELKGDNEFIFGIVKQFTEKLEKIRLEIPKNDKLRVEMVKAIREINDL
jgi:hypothetical protein